MKRDALLKALAAVDVPMRPADVTEFPLLDAIKNGGVPLGQLMRLPSFYGNYGSGKSNIYLMLARAAREHHERSKK